MLVWFMSPFTKLFSTELHLLGHMVHTINRGILGEDVLSLA